MAHGLSGTRRDGLGPSPSASRRPGSRRSSSTTAASATAAASPTSSIRARQLEDWRAAIAFARSLPGVDPERVATFGSSMGGGNALAAAADDQRVAAAISQVPFLDIVAPGPPLLAPGQPRGCCSPPSAAGTCRRSASRDEAAFINAPGGEAGWRHVVAIGEDSRWRNRVSSRWLLGAPYRPARHAAALHCPWLVCVGEADRVAKPGPAIAAARRAPLGELRTYPGVDHFDIYDGAGARGRRRRRARLPAPPPARRRRAEDAQLGAARSRRSAAVLVVRLAAAPPERTRRTRRGATMRSDRGEGVGARHVALGLAAGPGLEDRLGDLLGLGDDPAGERFLAQLGRREALGGDEARQDHADVDAVGRSSA